MKLTKRQLEVLKYVAAMKSAFVEKDNKMLTYRLGDALAWRGLLTIFNNNSGRKKVGYSITPEGQAVLDSIHAS